MLLDSNSGQKCLLAFQVALYLVSINQKPYSVKYLVNAFYSIKWVHSLNDKVSPTDSYVVKNVFEDNERTLANKMC